MAGRAKGCPGFIWANCWQWPFGTWYQLTQRQHCSICRLVLSLIVTDPKKNTLHPRLAVIDPEIQGTQLWAGETQATAGGEMVLKVEYGMQEVGDLRIVTDSNYTTALRQGGKAMEQQVSFQDFVSGTND